MKFLIEQIALCPRDPIAARKLLVELGMQEWANDHVKAFGTVFGVLGENEADLAFNYESLNSARELELLHYTAGDNWMRHWKPRISHLGMHCGAEELALWKAFFAERKIRIAQEVHTTSHSNPVIAGQRWYHYCIFDTHAILSVDLKFIVRCAQAPR